MDNENLLVRLGMWMSASDAPNVVLQRYGLGVVCELSADVRSVPVPGVGPDAPSAVSEALRKVGF